MNLGTFFWIIAAILFAVAAFIPTIARPVLGWLGCLFLTLGFLFAAAPIHLTT